MDFEKVKSELLEIDSRFRIERPDEDTIHICYGTMTFVCALKEQNDKWGFSVDSMGEDRFPKFGSFRDALNQVEDWWGFTKDVVTAPKPSDEEFRRQTFTDDPEVINKKLADYSNYWA